MPEDSIEFSPELKGSLSAIISAVVFGGFFLVYGLIQGSIGMSLFGVVGTFIMVFGYMLYLDRTTYTIKEDKVLYDKEIFGHKHQEIPMNRIQNTSLRQSALQQRMGGYGNVRISTAGSGGSDLTLRSIDHASEVHGKISELSNATSDGQSRANTDDGELNALEEAQKLRETSSQLKEAIRTRANQNRGDTNE